MTKDPKPYLQDILESIEKIETYLSGASKKEFMEDTQLQDSVVRRFEIMGEATKNIPAHYREEHPEVPWSKIAGTRDVLIHE